MLKYIKIIIHIYYTALQRIFQEDLAMMDKFFSIEKTLYNSRPAIRVGFNFPFSLCDTLECGQIFRYEVIKNEGGYIEYMLPIKEKLFIIGQERRGELLFFTDDEKAVTEYAIPFLDGYFDYTGAMLKIKDGTDSDWLRRACQFGEGIAILNQDAWECLISFIISQNNNIPRIRRIIREICYEYGECLATKNGLEKCPISRISTTPCRENCRGCGACYTFPTPEAIRNNPKGLLPSHPGFRYRYILDAVEKVYSGELSLDELRNISDYDTLREKLKTIVGVGDKVADCVALFGFHRLDSFPIDVWMRRAIDTYFDGKLNITKYESLAGLAQQYIFHYIRNGEGKA